MGETQRWFDDDEGTFWDVQSTVNETSRATGGTGRLLGSGKGRKDTPGLFYSHHLSTLLHSSVLPSNGGWWEATKRAKWGGAESRTSHFPANPKVEPGRRDAPERTSGCTINPCPSTVANERGGSTNSTILGYLSLSPSCLSLVGSSGFPLLFGLHDISHRNHLMIIALDMISSPEG